MAYCAGRRGWGSQAQSQNHSARIESVLGSLAHLCKATGVSMRSGLYSVGDCSMTRKLMGGLRARRS